MDKELENCMRNVDAWIVQIRSEFSEFSDIPNMVMQNTDNMQHNYELIYELKEEIEKLKLEISSLKLVQILMAKNSKKIEEIV